MRLAVVGVNALNPVLVGFVGGLRRQAVDDQIFRRAAVPKAVAKIDLDAADAPDALDTCQLGFAFLQRAMGAVAFVRDLLQMLPQALGGLSFRQDVRSIGKEIHTRRQPLPRPSHR